MVEDIEDLEKADSHEQTDQGIILFDNSNDFDFIKFASIHLQYSRPNDPIRNRLLK